MTDTTPHRATAKQWDRLQRRRLESGHVSAIIELRARVEALETMRETMRLAVLEWGKDVDKLMR